MENLRNIRGRFYFFTGGALIALAIILFLALFTAEGFAGRPEQTYELVMAVTSACILLASVLFTFFMLKRGRENDLNYFTTGCLRFVISSVMLGYAFTKLHHGHMYISYSALDTKLNDLNDFDTVWSFYGRYSAFQTLIGLLELIPATLLLFRRTAFIGAAIMLPVISNVVILNIFYKIGGFTLPVCLLILIFDLYVIYSYKEIIILFLKQVRAAAASPETVRPVTRRVFSIVKFLPLLLFGSLIVLNLFRPHTNTYPKGAFELVNFSVNGRELLPDSVPPDGYRKIYLEKRRLQSSLVNKEGPQGARIDFYAKDSLQIMYRNGPLDLYVAEDTSGMFKGTYRLTANGELLLTGLQNSQLVTARYKKMPLREFDYWWE